MIEIENEKTTNFSEGTQELLRLYFRVRGEPIADMDNVRIDADGQSAEDLLDFLKNGKQNNKTSRKDF